MSHLEKTVLEPSIEDGNGVHLVFPKGPWMKCIKCWRRDLNPYGGITTLRILSPMRLPISPLQRILLSYHFCPKIKRDPGQDFLVKKAGLIQPCLGFGLWANG